MISGEGAPGSRVLLGLGANLGDPARQLAEAVRRIGDLLGGVEISSVYRTAPLGYADQPDFLNLVCAGHTPMAPGELLERCQAIESALGRRRSFSDAPRTLDIDLLDLGGLVLATPELRLPHPRLHERGFVLAPLAEIAPAWRHPSLGRTAGELLASLPPGQRVERLGALPFLA